VAASISSGCSISPPRRSPPTAIYPGYTGFVEDSGEGRWTIAAALEEGVSAEVLSTALFTRFRSRAEHTFAEKVLSAMRKGFGGHIERPREEKVNPGL